MEQSIRLKKEPSATRKKTALTRFRHNADMYLLLLPGLLLLILFKYVPMYGIAIAFQDYNIFEGIGGSPWVGFTHFMKMFHSSEFYQVLWNTLALNIYKIIFMFPVPIILALMLNEIRNKVFTSTVQTILYIPHFLSWVVVGGLFGTILSQSSGIVNMLIKSLGGESIPFMTSNNWFRSVLVASATWKEAGYSAIIYIAAISGISQEIYEAAKIDGAGRIKQMIYITIPELSSTIILMLILRLGEILVNGTEQVLMMYNPVVYEVGDIIGSYVYRMGIGKMEYSFTTAVGLFESVVGFVLVLSGNALSKKMLGKSIW